MLIRNGADVNLTDQVVLDSYYSNFMWLDCIWMFFFVSTQDRNSPLYAAVAFAYSMLCSI